MADKQELELMFDALNSGMDLEASCMAAGLDYEEFQEEMAADRELARLILMAMANVEFNMMKIMLEVVEKNNDWRAAAWWLERRGHGFTKDKGEKKETEKKSAPVEIVVRKVGGEVFEEEGQADERED